MARLKPRPFKANTEILTLRVRMTAGVGSQNEGGGGGREDKGRRVSPR